MRPVTQRSGRWFQAPHSRVRPDTGSDRGIEVERLLNLGATRVEVGEAKAAPGEVTWVVLADPEGNEFCVLRGIDEQPDQRLTVMGDPEGNEFRFTE